MDQAKSEIANRVLRGTDLATKVAAATTEGALAVLQDEFKAWDEYNANWLENKFTNDRLKRKYTAACAFGTMTVLGDRESLARRREKLGKGIMTKVNELNSVIESLSLYADRDPGKPAYDATLPSYFHEKVLEVSGRLYEQGGHYRQAIFDTFVALEEEVRNRSGCTNLIGRGLMTTAFSVRNPILRVSDLDDEQQGYMELFSGATMAIRNPKAHWASITATQDEALLWLAFASSLFRCLDRATKEL